MARRDFQESFAGKGFDRPGDVFGGALLTSHPKTARPLESKLPIHLVLRANESRLRRLNTFEKVNRIVRRTSKKHGVRIYRYANVGNHIHLLIKIPSARAWAAYIRELAGRIAQAVRGFGAKSGKFWRHRPFTRIVRGWQRAFRSLCDYVELNHLEAEGYIKRAEIGSLKRLRLLWADG